MSGSTRDKWESLYGNESAVRAALSYVPAHDRDTWVRMGYAVKHGLGESGKDIWDAWGQAADSYDRKAANAVWRSIKAPTGRVSLSTLFWEATRHGFDPARDLGGIAPVDPQEVARRQAARAALDAAELAKLQAKREEAARIAFDVWASAAPAAADHPYLARKGVEPTQTLREIDAIELKRLIGYAPKTDGVPLQGRVLVAPVKVDGKLSTLEFIDGSGRKSALSGGAKSGGYWASGPLGGPGGPGEAASTIVIGEGIATVSSTARATGAVGVAALSCHNLPKVARMIRGQHPNADLVILADRGNGQEHAERAARETGARFAIPTFARDEWIDSARPTDFNDLDRLRGREAVAQVIAEARPLVSELGRQIESAMPVAIRDHAGNVLYEQDAAPSVAAAVESAVAKGVSLKGAALAAMNLDDTNLAGGDLAYADLRDASMRNADVQGTSFRGADLSGANLTGTDLAGAEIDGANLAGAKHELRSVDPEGQQLIAKNRDGAGGSRPGVPDAPRPDGEVRRTEMSDVTQAKSEKPARRSRKAAPEQVEPKATPTPAASDKLAVPAQSQAAPEKPAEPAKPDQPGSTRREVGTYLYELKDVPQEVKAAAQLRFGADLRMGVPRENASYKGEAFNTDRYLVQEVAPRSVVFHKKEGMEFVSDRLKWCNENQRLNGADIQVGYDGDKAKVFPYDRQRDQLEKAVASLKKSAKELGMGEDVGKTLDTLKDQSWSRVKEARSTALEQAKAARAQQEPARSATEGPDR
ncbi:hypothetical protein WK76_25055 [Burkholderia ubonensis]|uniref:pentapeptide repeat-containing protein n=1 Tax=Burkholderia ubonensis TaxID=101571 RepID=UPI0007542552|nr:PriCT-2 domain-containing protein [Burkholderia ubonensis]KVU84293.1 hypothetical protein WK76_25055 [Burkholderia ubonensis]